jgi:hypothetical protein
VEKMNAKINKIIQFCEELDAEFHLHSSCGLGRPCIGIIKGSGFISYNPLNDETNIEPYQMKEGDNEYDYITELYCEEFDKIKASDAYHKFDCLAVLLSESNANKNYEEAIDQLYEWVIALEKIGVEIVHYKSFTYPWEENEIRKVYSLRKKA